MKEWGTQKENARHILSSVFTWLTVQWTVTSSLASKKDAPAQEPHPHPSAATHIAHLKLVFPAKWCLTAVSFCCHTMQMADGPHFRYPLSLAPHLPTHSSLLAKVAAPQASLKVNPWPSIHLSLYPTNYLSARCICYSATSIVCTGTFSKI